MLAELAVRHPRLEISTSYSDRLVDLVGEGFDAAVRLGNLADSSLIARRIAPIRAVLVASPAYLARAGTPRTPADLARPRGRSRTATQVWQFRRDGKRFSHRPRGRFTADSGEAELAGVVAGLGIAMMPAFLAGPAIERGELVTLLDDYAIPQAGIYVVRPPPAEPVPIRSRSLTDILVEKFGGDDWDGRASRASSHTNLPAYIASAPCSQRPHSLRGFSPSTNPPRLWSAPLGLDRSGGLELTGAGPFEEEGPCPDTEDTASSSSARSSPSISPASWRTCSAGATICRAT